MFTKLMQLLAKEASPAKPFSLTALLERRLPYYQSIYSPRSRDVWRCDAYLLPLLPSEPLLCPAIEVYAILLQFFQRVPHYNCHICLCRIVGLGIATLICECSRQSCIRRMPTRANCWCICDLVPFWSNWHSIMLSLSVNVHIRINFKSWSRFARYDATGCRNHSKNTSCRRKGFSWHYLNIICH